MIKIICMVLLAFTTSNKCSKSLETKKYLTPISEIDLKSVLYETHIEVFNTKPSIHKVNMAWAQIAIENGRGNLVYNYNLGNIGIRGSKARKPFYQVAGRGFQAFASFKDGAKTYWSLLKNKCKGSLHYFNLGDVKSSALTLKRCNYYELDVDSYYKSMNSLFIQTSKK